MNNVWNYSTVRDTYPDGVEWTYSTAPITYDLGDINYTYTYTCNKDDDEKPVKDINDKSPDDVAPSKELLDFLETFEKEDKK